ncbi:hypothetical protein V5799_019235 [Amblyomma americanum]|uniref:Secreted protein n=1 Tax=Amblyomma americanum TaxID=6943 RepID=A0AAQ4EWX5_AMBAM
MAKIASLVVQVLCLAGPPPGPTKPCLTGHAPCDNECLGLMSTTFQDDQCAIEAAFVMWHYRASATTTSPDNAIKPSNNPVDFTGHGEILQSSMAKITWLVVQVLCLAGPPPGPTKPCLTGHAPCDNECLGLMSSTFQDDQRGIQAAIVRWHHRASATTTSPDNAIKPSNRPVNFRWHDNNLQSRMAKIASLVVQALCLAGPPPGPNKPGLTGHAPCDNECLGLMSTTFQDDQCAIQAAFVMWHYRASATATSPDYAIKPSNRPVNFRGHGDIFQSSMAKITWLVVQVLCLAEPPPGTTKPGLTGHAPCDNDCLGLKSASFQDDQRAIQAAVVRWHNRASATATSPDNAIKPSNRPLNFRWHDNNLKSRMAKIASLVVQVLCLAGPPPGPTKPCLNGHAPCDNECLGLMSTTFQDDQCAIQAAFVMWHYRASATATSPDYAIKPSNRPVNFRGHGDIFQSSMAKITWLVVQVLCLAGPPPGTTKPGLTGHAPCDNDCLGLKSASFQDDQRAIQAAVVRWHNRASATATSPDNAMKPSNRPVNFRWHDNNLQSRMAKIASLVVQVLCLAGPPPAPTKPGLTGHAPCDNECLDLMSATFQDDQHGIQAFIVRWHHRASATTTSPDNAIKPSDNPVDFTGHGEILQSSMAKITWLVVQVLCLAGPPPGPTKPCLTGHAPCDNECLGLMSSTFQDDQRGIQAAIVRWHHRASATTTSPDNAIKPSDNPVDFTGHGEILQSSMAKITWLVVQVLCLAGPPPGPTYPGLTGHAPCDNKGLGLIGHRNILQSSMAKIAWLVVEVLCLAGPPPGANKPGLTGHAPCDNECLGLMSATFKDDQCGIQAAIVMWNYRASATATSPDNAIKPSNRPVNFREHGNILLNSLAKIAWLVLQVLCLAGPPPGPTKPGLTGHAPCDNECLGLTSATFQDDYRGIPAAIVRWHHQASATTTSPDNAVKPSDDPRARQPCDNECLGLMSATFQDDHSSCYRQVASPGFRDSDVTRQRYKPSNRPVNYRGHGDILQSSMAKITWLVVQVLCLAGRRLEPPIPVTGHAPCDNECLGLISASFQGDQRAIQAAVVRWHHRASATATSPDNAIKPSNRPVNFRGHGKILQGSMAKIAWLVVQVLCLAGPQPGPTKPGLTGHAACDNECLDLMRATFQDDQRGIQAAIVRWHNRASAIVMSPDNATKPWNRPVNLRGHRNILQSSMAKIAWLVVQVLCLTRPPPGPKKPGLTGHAPCDNECLGLMSASFQDDQQGTQAFIVRWHHWASATATSPDNAIKPSNRPENFRGHGNILQSSMAKIASLVVQVLCLAGPPPGPIKPGLTGHAPCDNECLGLMSATFQDDQRGIQADIVRWHHRASATKTSPDNAIKPSHNPLNIRGHGNILQSSMAKITWLVVQVLCLTGPPPGPTKPGLTGHAPSDNECLGLMSATFQDDQRGIQAAIFRGHGNILQRSMAKIASLVVQVLCLAGPPPTPIKPGLTGHAPCDKECLGLMWHHWASVTTTSPENAMKPSNRPVNFRGHDDILQSSMAKITWLVVQVLCLAGPPPETTKPGLTGHAPCDNECLGLKSASCQDDQRAIEAAVVRLHGNILQSSMAKIASLVVQVLCLAGPPPTPIKPGLTGHAPCDKECLGLM